jgi:hypothetical protein
VIALIPHLGFCSPQLGSPRSAVHSFGLNMNASSYAARHVPEMSLTHVSWFLPFNECLAISNHTSLVYLGCPIIVALNSSYPPATRFAGFEQPIPNR